MSKPLFLIFILNCCETMKILSSMIVIIILISSGCLGIFEDNVDNVTITLNKMEHWSSEIPPHP